MVWLHAKSVPFTRVEKTDDKEKQRLARLHLTKANLGFRDAVKREPDNMVARMGLAWTLKQSGERSVAIKQFRSLIDHAWKHEKTLSRLPLNGTIVTEAAGYLIPLLDKQ